MDEFIVDRGRVSQLKDYKGKIERMYDVQIGFQEVAKVDSEAKQWVTVHGENMDRQDAKEYILALCHPREKQCFPVQGFMNFLTYEKLEQIEKTTKAVMVINKDSSVAITGTDLGVTLAMSSLEDLLRQCSDIEEDGNVSETKTKELSVDDSLSPFSQRLDTSLQRALSQQSDGNCSIEDYGNTSASVKRVILHCLNDTANDNIDDDLLFISSSPGNQDSSQQFKLPLLIGDEPSGSSKAQTTKYISDHDRLQIDGRVGNLTQQFTDANISKTSSSPPPPLNSLPNSKLSKELDYLKTFGISVGYSTDVVEEGLKFADENTQVADFIEILGRVSDNKSEKKVDSLEQDDAAEVEILSPSKFGNFPPPPPIPCPSKLSDLSSRRSLPPEYKSKLIKDFTEENSNLPIEELKRRNEERQQVLKASFDDNKTPQKNGNQFSPRQGKGDKNGHQFSPRVLKSKANKNKKASKKGKQQQTVSNNTTEGSTKCIVLEDDDEEEDTCVMEPWDDNLDDCKIVNVSEPKHVPVVVQPSHVQSHSAVVHGKSSPYKQQQPLHTVPFAVQQQYPKQTSSIPHLPTAPIIGKQPELRYIVIDGSNVAMTHGNGKIFSCRGIKICIEHFLKRGHKQVTAFVPEWRKYRPRVENSIRDQNLLTELKEEGYLVFTPSRRVNGKLISSYDDRFVLELAEREDGVIVSNDQYRDLMQEKTSWRSLVEERLLMFTFAGDNFMIPEDPLGATGPTLDELLHKTPIQKGTCKRPLSPDKAERGNYRQPNRFKDMPVAGIFNNPPLPIPMNQFNRPPPLLQFRPSHTDGNAFRGAHRGRGNPVRQRYPQPNKFTALASRSESATQELFTQLKSIFTEAEQEQKLRKVLQNHREETDLNRLTNYCINAIFS